MTSPRAIAPSRRVVATGLCMLVALLIAAPLAAQQKPLTGRMLSTPVPQPDTLPVVDVPDAARPPQTPWPAIAPGRSGSDFGDATRSLFALQADPHRPGVQRPVTGEQASAAYRRYLRSFEHDIPEMFDINVAEQPARGR